MIYLRILLLLGLMLAPHLSLASILTVNDYQTKQVNIADYPIIAIKPLDKPHYLLVNNLNNDSYGQVLANEHVSSSRMGPFGYYVLLLPISQSPTEIQFKSFENQQQSKPISITLFSLKDQSAEFKSAIENMAVGSQLKLEHYFGKEDQSTKVAELFNQALLIFRKQNKPFYNALAAFESAVITNQLGMSVQSIQLLNESIKLWGINHNDLQMAQALNMRGLYQWQAQQLEPAQTSFEQSLQWYIKHQNISLQAQAHSNLGLLSYAQGLYQKAQNKFLQALQINGIKPHIVKGYSTIEFEQIRNYEAIKSIAATINNLALTYDALGDTQTAESLWEVYLKSVKLLSNSVAEGIALNNLSMLHIKKGNFDLTQTMLTRAREIFTNANNNWWLSLAEHNLGQLYTELGQFNLAIIQFEKALQLRSVENNPKGRIESLLKLVDIKIKRNRFAETADLLLEINNIAEQTNNNQAKVLVAFHRHQMSVHEKDYVQAKKNIDYALQLADGKSYQRLFSRLKVAQARVNLFAGHPQEAIQTLTTEAVKILQFWDVNLLNQARNLLAVSLYKNKQHEEALTVIETEINHLNQLLALSDSHTIQSSINRNLRETMNTLAVLSNGAEQRNMALSKLNQQRLHAQAMTANKTISSEQSIEPLLLQLSSKSFALENTKLSAVDRQFIQNDLIELKSQVEFLYKVHIDQQTEHFDLKQLQQNLLSDTLMVQFSTGEYGGVSWWISQNSISSFTLPDKYQLIELIQLSRNELLGIQNGFKNTQLLAKTLLSPLKDFPNVKHLIIIPDAPLNLIPFTALGDPRKQYSQALSEDITIEQRTIAQQSNSHPTKQSIKPHQVLVVADPITHINDARINHLTKDENSFHQFKRLMGTAAEASQIQQLTQAQTLVGFEANKKKVMAVQLNSIDTLHFATHAFFNAESPDLSALVLSAYDESGNSQSSFLRAYEIKNMSLDLNLVVLSGCETGIEGIDDAYGLGGLSQAFLDAGTKQLIASLWQVDDVITSQLMSSFYQFYTAGISAAQALALAQQSLRNNSSTSHPKYWSGWFIITN